MSTDWRALCEELLSALETEAYAHWIGDADSDPLIVRARTALAEPVAEGVTPSDEELFRIASDSDALYIADDRDCDNYSEVVSAMRAAIAADRARFGRPAPAPAGEVAELVRRLRYVKQNGNSIPSRIHWGLDDGTEHQGSIYVGSNHAADCARAADLLEQRHPAPVPVSERLPGPEDCDVGRCYWGRQVNSRRWSWTFSIDPQGDTHWLPASVQSLPATALPLPQGVVK